MVATSVASGYGLPPYDLLNLTSNLFGTSHRHFIFPKANAMHEPPPPLLPVERTILNFPPCRRHPFLCKQLRTLLFRASRLRQQRRPCRTSLIRLFELKVPARIAFQSNQQPPTLPSDDVTKWHFRFRLPSIPLRFKPRFAHLIYRRR